MGKQRLEQVTVETLRPKEYRWKLGARLKYVREKKYVANGKEKKLITGVIEGEQKQLKFNIWSDKVSATQLQPNNTYSFSRGKLEDGVINLHDWSAIEPAEDTGTFPTQRFYNLRDLMELPSAEKIIDFQACILEVGEVLPGTTKEGRQYRKQQVECGDLESRLRITVTMWDGFLSKAVRGFRCTFEGFKYKVYCGSQQLNSTVFSKIRTELTEGQVDMSAALLEGHWHNMSELYRQRTFGELKQLLSEAEPAQSFYSEAKAEIVNYIGQECYQEICPRCGLKLRSTEAQWVCQPCRTGYPQGERRLLMRFLLRDGTEQVKAKAYNYISGKLLEAVGSPYSPSQLQLMTSEELRQVLSPLFGRLFRLRLVSNILVHEDTRFENHSIKQVLF